MITINDYLSAFENWIIAHNFDGSSLYNDPKRVEEFLTWLQIDHSYLLKKEGLYILVAKPFIPFLNTSKTAPI